MALPGAKGEEAPAEKDGIFIQFRLNNVFPMKSYKCLTDRPRNRRHIIRYVESKTNENFAVEVMFLSQELLKFDPSTHFRIVIHFEGRQVWSQKIASRRIQAGWKKNVEKANQGAWTGRYFYFMPVEFPEEMERCQLAHRTDQGTVFVQFFRMEAIEDGGHRLSRTQQQQHDDYSVPQKVLLKDPTKRLSHRPGLRPRQDEGLLQTGHIRFSQIDDEAAPYYNFEFRLRSAELLRMLGIIPPTEQEYYERVGRAHGVNQEFEGMVPPKDEAADDDVVLLFSKTKEAGNADNETGNEPQTQDNAQASGSEKKVPKMSGARHASSMKQERVPRKLNGQAEVNKFRESFRKFTDSRHGSTRLGSALNGAKEQESPMFVPNSIMKRIVQLNKLGNRDNPVEINSQSEA